MAGLTARIQIVSNALILLGDSPISSLTENSTGATLGANLFENTYLAMLQDHRWRFASKTQELNRLSAVPKTKYSYKFSLPNDFLYAIKGDARDFEIYGSEIHTNSPTFQLDYIHRVAEDILPAYFVKALEFNLAAQFAIPLTGDIDKGSYYTRVFTDAIRRAKNTDSIQYPETSVVDAPYVDIRY